MSKIVLSIHLSVRTSPYGAIDSWLLYSKPPHYILLSGVTILHEKSLVTFDNVLQRTRPGSSELKEIFHSSNEYVIGIMLCSIPKNVRFIKPF